MPGVNPPSMNLIISSHEFHTDNVRTPISSEIGVCTV